MISRPHTPTDNAAAETKNRGLKQEAGLASGARLCGTWDAAHRLGAALERVDAGRLRATRGYKSAKELDRTMPRARAVANRRAFYDDARSAIETAVLGLTTAKQVRKAEQDAVWRTLEKHQLARTHVGLRRAPSRQPPPVATQAAGLECTRGHLA